MRLHNSGFGDDDPQYDAMVADPQRRGSGLRLVGQHGQAPRLAVDIDGPALVGLVL